MCRKSDQEEKIVEKEKFFSGLWIIIGLILGSLFTNFVYQDYLAYGGTVRSLILNNTDLYKASVSLFFYIFSQLYLVCTLNGVQNY